MTTDPRMVRAVSGRARTPRRSTIRRRHCAELLAASRAARAERMLHQLQQQYPTLFEGLRPSERFDRVLWCIVQADRRRFTRWSDGKVLATLLLYFGPGLLEIEAVTRVLDDDAIPRERRLDALVARLDSESWAALVERTRGWRWPSS